MEQTLGHRTHAENLRRALEHEPIRPVWLPVPWEAQGLIDCIPGVRANWTVRAGLHARRMVADAYECAPLDALFVHTQVPAVLLGRWSHRLPTIVSIDATPEQYDSLGSAYHHRTGPRALERAKWAANRRCFHRAAAIVAWSEWARQGLVDGYGVPPQRVVVIPPGVRRAEWRRPTPRPLTPGEGLRILFVGGDLERKGGSGLLRAFAELQRRAAQRSVRSRPEVELHVVTASDVPEQPGVVAHHGLGPNSPTLRELYHSADIFCLPTLGDCLPMVLSEAGAAGLPLVATDVGGVSEVVRDGQTGLLVPPSDVGALTDALDRLVLDGALRRRLGDGAAELVGQEFDADANASRLVGLIRSVAEGRGASGADRAGARPDRADG